MRNKVKLALMASAPIAALLAGATPANAGFLANYTGSGVNIRTCASTSCTSVGLGYPT
jgi:hypothetical protein